MRSNALKLVEEQEGSSEASNALSVGAYSLAIFQVLVKFQKSWKWVMT